MADSRMKYTKNELAAAGKIFAKNKSIQLKQFVQQAQYEKLCRSIERLQWKKKIEYDKFNYKTAPLPKELLEFFQSQDFLETVLILSGKTPKEVICELRLFEHENYTLLHDEIVQPEGIAFELEFTPIWNEKWGGCTSFVRKKKEFARITPTPNTLTIVQQDKNTKSFVKYVNHLAENKKVVLMGSIIVVQNI